MLGNPSLAYTVFAPNNDAFIAAEAALGVTEDQLFASVPALQSLLYYHMVTVGAYNIIGTPYGTTSFGTLAGPVGSVTGGISVNRPVNTMSLRAIGTGAAGNVVVPDISAGSSVVHIIDAVLLPFYKTMLQAISSAPQLSLFQQMITAAGLQNLFNSLTLTYTVFASTNQGYADTLGKLGILPQGLIIDPVLLSKFLNYTMLADPIPTKSMVAGTSAVTLLPGKLLGFSRSATNQVVVSPIASITAKVIVEDVPIGMGPKAIMQVIDQVLVPDVISVTDAARNAGCNTFLQALSAQGSLGNLLSNPQFFGTVFVPSDSAFALAASFLGTSVSALLADTTKLTWLLRAHVVPANVLRSPQLVTGLAINTLSGNATLLVAVNGASITLKAAQTSGNIISADNMVNFGKAAMHVVDQVLIPANPETVSISSIVNATAELSLLKAAIDTTGMQGALSDPSTSYTFFAPTNAAFSNTLLELGLVPDQLLGSTNTMRQIVQYLTLPVGAIKFNQFPQGTTRYPTLAGPSNSTNGVSVQALQFVGVRLLATGNSPALTQQYDIKAGNSVIHYVDQIPLPFFKTMLQGMSTLPSLSMFYQAVQVANMVATFSDPRTGYTIFAPSNDAFNLTLQQLGYTWSQLLGDPATVTSIVQYAVVTARPLLVSDMTNVSTPYDTLLPNKQLLVTKLPGDVVNVRTAGGVDCKVVTPNIAVGVGPRSVIHLMDRVLLPDYTTITGALATQGLTYTLQALTAEGTVFSLLNDPTFRGTVFAPSNAGWDKYAASIGQTWAQVLANKPALNLLLRNHVVDALAIPRSSMLQGQKISTLRGSDTLTVDLSFGGVSLRALSSIGKIISPTDTIINYGKAILNTVSDVLVPDMTTPGSIMAALQGYSSFSILRSAISAANMQTLLSDPSLTYTMFAPSDNAFNTFLAEAGMTSSQLLASGAALQTLLRYHICPTNALSVGMLPYATVPLATLNGPADSLTGGLKVTRFASNTAVVGLGSGGNISMPDIKGGLSWIHMMDTVLLPYYRTIAQATSQNPGLLTLNTAINEAGLQGTFSNPGVAYTLFAPTNDAFVSTLSVLGLNIVSLLADKPTLTSVLQYHVLPSGALAAAQLANQSYFTLLSGKSVTVARAGAAVVVRPVSGIDASVTIPDIPVGFGPKSIVHIVDKVLVPEFSSVAVAATANGLGTFMQAVVADGTFVASATDPKWAGTVFAPTNAAWDRAAAALNTDLNTLFANKPLLNSILKNHIVQSAVLRTSGFFNGQKLTTLSGPDSLAIDTSSGYQVVAAKATARITTPDVSVNYARSMVQVVDQVLIPDVTTPAASIYAAISALSGMNTLVRAIDAAGLKDTLSNGALAYTVFAPNDAAFNSLLSDLNLSVDQLLALPSLGSWLRYHVLDAGALRVDAIALGVNAMNTLAGASNTLTGGVRLSRDTSGLHVLSTGADSAVVTPDLAAGQSIVHVVNAVLLPFYKSINQAVAATPSLSTLSAALTAAGMANSLNSATLSYTLFAPTNDGFAATLASLGVSASTLLADVPTLTSLLQLHVVTTGPQVSANLVAGVTLPTSLSGKSLLVGRSGTGAITVTSPGNTVGTVVTSDVPVGPGYRSVIQIIDKLLLPDAGSGSSGGSDILSVAKARGLNTFVQAVTAEGSLVADLSNAATVATVFAPSDAAWTAYAASLGKTLDKVLAEKAALAKVLKQCIVKGSALKDADLISNQKLPTMLGGRNTLQVDLSTAFVVKTKKTSAKVITQDVPVAGGKSYIQVVDTVLLPGAKGKAKASGGKRGMML